MDFNKIVKKMGKKCGKIMFKNDIFELIDPEKKESNKNKLNKIIYRLKAKNIIVSLKSGIYVIPNLEDKKLNNIDLFEKYYWKILKKYITYYVGSNYYIQAEKALQIHNKDFSTPEKIFIINRNLNKKITLKNFEIIFKTINTTKNGKKINLYSKFSLFTTKKIIENIEFKISNLEMSLIESAIINDTISGFNISLINKTIKKYHKIFNYDIFYEIGKYKYIMAFNRLKELSKNIDKKLYQVFLDIIKKNGGLFIGEGLRGI